ncbi:translation initiation factor IF-2 N-terminal domain-containing protein [Corynebacterium hansenii]|uniref:Translation initiation factor IF-2 N-terminal domain-containing protein n=1 Tax=Corynebacterium hansenii TaxID=394964 RepID=A0ABV7ZKX9_9CORY|nr:translation initiation factor IF-2 N-terminal domain-containing protein [Corynebacterium hansenii]WJY99368.1 Ribonuclease E [Corynebacterium hansenii]
MLKFSDNTVSNARDFDRASAPEKMRVHALAKAVGITSKELIAALGEMGVAVKSASSSVAAGDRDRFLDAVAKSGSLDDVVASQPSDAPVEGAAEQKAGENPGEPAKKTAAKATKKTAKKSAAKSTENAAKKASEPNAKKTTAKKATATAPVDADEDAAERKTEKKTAKKAAKKTSKKTAKRTAGKKSAPAKKADEVDVAETIVAEAPAVPETPETPDAPETSDTAAADTGTPEKATRRSRSRRTAKRTASKPAAPAKKAEDVDVAEPIIPDSIDGATEDDHLVEVVPPVTPPPAEPSFAIPVFMAPEPVTVVSADVDDASADAIADAVDDADDSDDRSGSGDDSDRTREPRPRRRRRGRGRGRGAQDDSVQNDGNGGDDRDDRSGRDDESGAGSDAAKRGDAGVAKQDGKKRDERDADDEPEVPVVDEPVAIKGSTRLEAQRRRRADRRAESRKRHVISEAEFLARRESVERTMVVRERRRRDGHGMVTQVGVLEDDLLVEHFVTSDTQTSIIGDIYLGRVQNVLPSMEAAFIDIGTDRNGVLYSADVNWRAFGSSGRSRRIEHALKAGDQVLVQATKDPVGHKGARLSMQISLAGRFLVYVPGGHSAGISRKLPEPERKRLKEILKEVTPAGSGTIIRTAAEGVSKEAIAADVQRLEGLWQDIDKRTAEAKSRKGAKPVTMYEEPNMLIKVVRDLFNEDFSRLVVEGDKAWGIVRSYVDEVAPDLVGRLQRYRPEQHGGEDVFAHHRIDEQLAKALDRKVWLPSGGTLIIERTEAMTVIDVNTGKFTGAGGNLEETVTRNNLEAAEEIVRQMRLRDLGGMIVVDFIDMVLPENQDLVLRRLKEALGRDRTRHEVSEVTSLGLVQMTRKRLGTGLLETFSTTCEACDGRGLIIHVDPVDHEGEPQRGRQRRRNQAPAKHPVAEAMHRKDNGDDRAEVSAKDSADEGREEQLDDGRRDASSDGRDGNGGNGRRRRSRRGARRGGAGQGPEQSGDDRARDDRSGGQSDDRPGVESEQAPAEEMTEEERAVDESVTRAESEESRPPRRRRRGRRSTSRGRGGDGEGRGDDGRSSDDADARRRETSRDNRDEHADVGDALARVAADAVAEARDKDPDEPSDDRYVSRSARRRRRRRVVHASQQGQGARDDVREDAQRRDSGEVEAQREAKAETPSSPKYGAEADEPEKPAQDDSGRTGAGAGRSGGGSRGRRRSTSRRGSGQGEQRGKGTAEVSEAPEKTVSVEAKPERGADDAPIEPQTYEEALAAFEKSPRRNRPTRGRSRSDHAPKPEDFGEGAGARKGGGDAKGGAQDKSATESKGDAKGAAESKGGAGEKSGKSPAKGSGDGAGKGGRGESGAAKASDGSRAESSSSDGSKAGSAEAAKTGSGDGRPARRRGRRRAVRRVTSRGPAGTSADAPKKDAPKKDASPKAKSSGAQGEGKDGGVAKQDDAGRKPRRGRRRAVRRTSRG